MPSLSSELLKQILEEARFAPSGDNIQPWLFKIHPDHSLVLHRNEPENLLASDYFSSGPPTGLGCMLESVVIAALHYGFSSEITLHKQTIQRDSLVATLHFTPAMFPPKDQTENEKLFQVLQKRRTDRRPYKKQALSEPTKQLLLTTVLRAGGRVHFVEGQDLLRSFGKALAIGDQYFWNDAHLRNNLIRTVHFFHSKQRVGSGMPITTLGLGPVNIFFKPTLIVAYHFPWLWKIIGRSSKTITQRHVSSSAALIFLTLPKLPKNETVPRRISFQSCLLGGRIAQRFWLFATTLGLSLQPQFAFVAMAHNEKNKKLGSAFLDANREIMAFLESRCPWLEKEELIFAFRIGYPTSKKAAPTSPRKRIEEILWHP